VGPTEYELYGRIMELVHFDPFFDKRSSWSLKNSMFYAVKHGKCLTHYVDGRLVGFCMWGFFTEEEIRTNRWNGDAAFARSDGEVMYVSQFQCRAGPAEVLKFVRNIQKTLSGRVSGKDIAAAHRRYASGGMRDSLWHRKTS
jgi:hemolysin-activating ACP:hemolysin acyltransferase